ncbi:alpha-N-acetylgalactosaminidase-like [Acanthaster planci]|uniref:Alpha-galactosidase n=1 Tax=Acanthaster planci TaxID=133434 RepID=A0A8B7YZY9_ACAPL|nr:alpha-N-acetylgalactosaminidase-like [Acanthaster planci]XP_022098914.1 alpha-N-acetylgalactosaminidase-like [Acanthaster planci]
MFLPVLLGICVLSVHALDNGLGRTPPMGWMTWERFRCNTNCAADPDNCISEKLMMTMANHLVDDGYKDVGYQYVNVDDCWPAKERDGQGRLQADPDRFPSGIKALADYMHSKGLKLGIYEDYGTKTCAGYPGSLGHLETDAETFAEWGVDMLKMDGCNSNITTMKKGYPQMSTYLNATGRPILFSCSWPDYERAAGIKINYTLVAEYCNIWRNYVDIQDSWNYVLQIIDYYAENQDILSSVSKPGSFNDPDMLILGDYALSVYQAKAQFAMWAVMAAPLLMSNDLRTLDPRYRDILQNKQVIKVNQDPLGIMGKRVLKLAIGLEVWLRPLVDQSYAMVILSRNDRQPVRFNTTLDTLGLHRSEGYDLMELWDNTPLGRFKPFDFFTLNVDPSFAEIIRLTP